MYNKILVPLDGSDFGECTLDHIRAIASGCHASEVILLSVVGNYEPGSGWTWGGIISESVAADAAKKAQVEARKYLSKVAKKLEKDGINAVTTVMVGIPADIILDYANSAGVDLIIMATHGRSGPARWAMGSVAERVVSLAQMPVMVVSPKGCRI